MLNRLFLVAQGVVMCAAMLFPLKGAVAADFIGIDRQAIAQANGSVRISEGIGFINSDPSCRINPYIEGSNLVTFMYLELDAGGPGIVGDYSLISVQLQPTGNGECTARAVYNTPFQHGRVFSQIFWNGILDFGLGDGGIDSFPFNFIYSY
jgi:hypothetical protein